MKRSICFISFSAYPLFRPECKAIHGGAELDTYYTAEALAKRGHAVQFVVGDFGQQERETIGLIAVWRGIPIGKSSLVQSIRNTARLFSIWRRINADVYFTKGAGFLPFQIAPFCKLHRKKFVLKTSHKQNIDGSLKGKPYFLPFRWAMRQASLVMVQNQDDLPLLQNTFGISGVVSKNYHPEVPSPDDAFEKREFALWVGRFSSIKQPDTLLELATMLPQLRFTMVCSVAGESREWSEFRERCTKTPNLQLVTNVPHQDIDKYYQRATLFISTSRGEGFPNTFIESMQNGAPIASLHVNPDEFITRENVGVFGEGKLSILSQEIEKVVRDPERWKTLSHRCVQYVHRNFGTSVIDGIEEQLARL